MQSKKLVKIAGHLTNKKTRFLMDFVMFVVFVDIFKFVICCDLFTLPK